ncbi:hypothetical protein JW865_09460 [Candidatus Bathyarchaeota archaeon]|nr:hypothetical protein [Candidatus Bathyarchaeota archaeon]
MAYDNADGVTSTVWVEEGAFELIRLTTTHTISQINQRASTSYSYSETGI